MKLVYAEIETKEYIMELCAKCLLPECFPNITFDDKGVCNYCREYQPINYFGEKNLEKLISGYRRPGQYECVVPISGGRDSAFVLHQIVKQYHLKPLVFNYDNGFATDKAKENIRNAIECLRVDLVQKKSKRDIQTKLMGENLKLNIKKSPLHVLRDLCNGCANGYKGGALSLARKMRIPLIFFGDSKVEESVYKKVIFENITPGIKEKLLHLILQPANFAKRKYYNYLLDKEFPFNNTISSEVQNIHFFDYIEWDEEKIVKTIQKDLSWSGDDITTWRVDCKVHSLVDYLTYKLNGYNEKDEFYSKLIRQGKIEREVAIELLKSLRKRQQKEIPEIFNLLHNLGIDNKQIHTLLNI